MSESEKLGRIPLLHPGQLTDEQRHLYDRIAGGERANGPFRMADDQGRLLGPFNVLLQSPGVGGAIERLGAALRFHGGLADRVRELVICAVAAHWRSDYEWYAHRRVSRQIGISDADLDALWRRQVPDGLSDGEAAALLLARALLEERSVSEQVYAVAHEHHGTAGVMEMCVVVGYYQLLAGMLSTFDIAAPPDEEN